MKGNLLFVLIMLLGAVAYLVFDFPLGQDFNAFRYVGLCILILFMIPKN